MRIYDGRESFYQWDLNQKITSDEFKVGDEIHFFNIRQSDALVVKAYELDGVVVANVPNILLQVAQPIIAWKYVYDEHSAQTVMEHTFGVNQRPQPADYVYSETEVLSYNTLLERIIKLEQGGGGGDSVATSRIAYIDLPSANWQGSDSLYSQVVSIDGVTEYSKVDINPSVEQLVVFYKKDIAFVTENEDGVVTVYCVGQKPMDDYNMQVTITEVTTNG